MGAAGSSGRLTQLLTQRRDLLRKIAAYKREQFRAGTGTLAEVENASIAAFQADLDLPHSKKERLAIYEQWAVAARELEKQAETQQRAGLITPAAYLEAQEGALEAEIGLEREKTGLPAHSALRTRFSIGDSF